MQWLSYTRGENHKGIHLFSFSFNDLFCEIPDMASIGALPTEAGDGLEDLDTYSPQYSTDV
jgi:hypothetical protein